MMLKGRSIVAGRRLTRPSMAKASGVMSISTEVPVPITTLTEEEQLMKETGV